MESQMSFLGENVTIENGAIATTEDFVSAGRICSKLISTANVVIGASSYFEGQIIAHNVEIQGAFKGDVVVKQCAIIRSGSEFSGKIKAFSLSIESGAAFSGQSTTISVEEFNKISMSNKIYAKLAAEQKEPKLLTHETHEVHENFDAL